MKETVGVLAEKKNYALFLHRILLSLHHQTEKGVWQRTC